MPKQRTAVPPYWLVGFEVFCGTCHALHAHAVAAHCVACDRPLCLTCRVTRNGEILCSECDEKERKHWRRARSGKA